MTGSIGAGGAAAAAEARARRRLTSLPGLTWAPFERVDLPEIAEFYRLCEENDENPERRSLSGLQEFWDAPRSRPESDTLVARETTGRVVATAWSGCNRVIRERRGVHLGGSVLPDRRGEGIGRRVLAWQLAHARAWDEATREPDHGPLVMRMHVPTRQSDVRHLAVRHGLALERFFLEMARSLDDDQPGAGDLRRHLAAVTLDVEGGRGDFRVGGDGVS